MLLRTLPTSLRGAVRPLTTRWLSSDRPIVPAMHPEHTRVREALGAASGPWQLLRIFEEEREQYGWLTAKDTINRITGCLLKQQAMLSTVDPGDKRVSCDPRFVALLELMTTALRQQVMSSRAPELGEAGCDLHSLRDALLALKLHKTELFSLLDAKLREEDQGTGRSTRFEP